MCEFLRVVRLHLGLGMVHALVENYKVRLLGLCAGNYTLLSLKARGAWRAQVHVYNRYHECNIIDPGSGPGDIDPLINIEASVEL